MPTLNAAVEKLFSSEHAQSQYFGNPVPQSIKTEFEAVLVSLGKKDELTEFELAELFMIFDNQVAELEKQKITGGYTQFLRGFASKADPGLASFKAIFYGGYDPIAVEKRFGQAVSVKTSGLRVDGRDGLDAAKTEFSAKFAAALQKYLAQTPPPTSQQLQAIKQFADSFSFLDRKTDGLVTKTASDKFGFPTGTESPTTRRGNLNSLIQDAMDRALSREKRVQAEEKKAAAYNLEEAIDRIADTKALELLEEEIRVLDRAAQFATPDKQQNFNVVRIKAWLRLAERYKKSDKKIDNGITGDDLKSVLNYEDQATNALQIAVACFNEMKPPYGEAVVAFTNSELSVLKAENISPKVFNPIARIKAAQKVAEELKGLPAGYNSPFIIADEHNDTALPMARTVSMNAIDYTSSGNTTESDPEEKKRNVLLKGAIAAFNIVGVDFIPANYTIQNVQSLWNNGVGGTSNVAGLLAIVGNQPLEAIEVVAGEAWFQNLLNNEQLPQIYNKQSLDKLLIVWNKLTTTKNVAIDAWKKPIVAAILTKAQIAATPDNVVDFILANPSVIPETTHSFVAELLVQAFSATNSPDKHLSILKLLAKISPDNARPLWSKMPVTPEFIASCTSTFSSPESSAFVEQVAEHAIRTYQNLFQQDKAKAFDFIYEVDKKISAQASLRASAAIKLTQAHYCAMTGQSARVFGLLASFAHDFRRDAGSSSAGELGSMNQQVKTLFNIDLDAFIGIVAAAEMTERDRIGNGGEAQKVHDDTSQALLMALQGFLAGNADKHAALGKKLGPYREVLHRYGLSEAPAIVTAFQKAREESQKKYAGLKQEIANLGADLKKARLLVKRLVFDEDFEIINQLVNDATTEDSLTTCCVAILFNVSAVDKLTAQSLENLVAKIIAIDSDQAVQNQFIGRLIKYQGGNGENCLRIWSAIPAGSSYKAALADAMAKINRPNSFDAVVQKQPVLFSQWFQSLNDNQIKGFLAALDNSNIDVVYTVFQSLKAFPNKQRIVARYICDVGNQLKHGKFAQLKNLQQQWEVFASFEPQTKAVQTPAEQENTKQMLKRMASTMTSSNVDELSLTAKEKMLSAVLESLRKQWEVFVNLRPQVMAEQTSAQQEKEMRKHVADAKRLDTVNSLPLAEKALLAVMEDESLLQRVVKALPVHEIVSLWDKHKNDTVLWDQMFMANVSMQKEQEIAIRLLMTPHVVEQHLPVEKLIFLVEQKLKGLSSGIFLRSDTKNLRERLVSRFIEESRVVEGMQGKDILAVAKNGLAGKNTKREIFNYFRDLNSDDIRRPYVAALLVRRADLLSVQDSLSNDEITFALREAELMKLPLSEAEIGKINYDALARRGIWVYSMSALHLQEAIKAEPDPDKRASLISKVPACIVADQSTTEAVASFLVAQYCHQQFGYAPLQKLLNGESLGPQKGAIPELKLPARLKAPFAKAIGEHLIAEGGIEALMVDPKEAQGLLNTVFNNIDVTQLQALLSPAKLAAMSVPRQQALQAGLERITATTDIEARAGMLRKAIDYLEKSVLQHKKKPVVSAPAPISPPVKKGFFARLFTKSKPEPLLQIEPTPSTAAMLHNLDRKRSGGPSAVGVAGDSAKSRIPSRDPVLPKLEVRGEIKPAGDISKVFNEVARDIRDLCAWLKVDAIPAGKESSLAKEYKQLLDELEKFEKIFQEKHELANIREFLWAFENLVDKLGKMPERHEVMATANPQQTKLPAQFGLKNAAKNNSFRQALAKRIEAIKAVSFKDALLARVDAKIAEREGEHAEKEVYNSDVHAGKITALKELRKRIENDPRGLVEHLEHIQKQHGAFINAVDPGSTKKSQTRIFLDKLANDFESLLTLDLPLDKRAVAEVKQKFAARNENKVENDFERCRAFFMAEAKAQQGQFTERLEILSTDEAKSNNIHKLNNVVADLAGAQPVRRAPLSAADAKFVKANKAAYSNLLKAYQEEWKKFAGQLETCNSSDLPAFVKIVDDHLNKIKALESTSIGSIFNRRQPVFERMSKDENRLKQHMDPIRAACKAMASKDEKPATPDSPVIRAGKR